MRRLLFRRWSRSARTPLAMPHPWWWLTACFVVAVVLGYAVWTHARTAYEAQELEDWPRPAQHAYDLWRNMFAGSTRSAAILVVFVLVLWLFRRFRLALLVRRPGPIDVPPLENATRTTTVPVAELTTRLRTTLAGMNLDSPAAIPGAGRPTEFLELLKSAGSHQNPLASLAGLLGLTWVTHALRLSAVLRRREGPTPCGITVSVTTLPKGGSPPVTLWAATWQEAVDEAASAVGAAILPLTRLSTAPPWRTWRGLALPTELFADYREAKALAADHRYDEALGKYYDALARDPLNLYLRLEVGQLQERLRLFMDALETYDDIVAMGTRRDERIRDLVAGAWDRYRPPSSSADGLDRTRMWGRRRHVGLQPAPWRRRSTDRLHVLLLARYRYALVLGSSEVLLSQWIKAEHRPPSDQPGVRAQPQRSAEAGATLSLRDQERFRLRTRLLPRLCAYDRGDDPSAGALRPVTPDCPGFRPQATDVLLAQELLQRAARAEIRRLSRDYGWLTGRRRRGTPVTCRALRLSIVWADQRLDRVRWLLQRHRAGVPPRWPLPYEQVQREVRRRFWSLPWFGFEWQDHYNAACIYAIRLMPQDVWAGQESGMQLDGPPQPDGCTPADVERYAHAVARCLERAIDSSDSSFAAGRRSWVSSEDPDLVGFRRSSEYASFRARNFPAADAPVPRPTGVHLLELSTYVAEILRAIAAAQCERWADDTESGRPFLPAALEAERERDARSWAHVRDVAVGHRDWRVRLRALRHLHELAGTKAGNAVPYPRFPDPRMGDLDLVSDPGNADCLQRATTWAHRNRDEQTTRLGGLAREHCAGLAAGNVDTDPAQRQELWRLLLTCLRVQFLTDDLHLQGAQDDAAARAERRLALTMALRASASAEPQRHDEHAVVRPG